MNHLGEIISLIVAFSWTATALFAEVAVRQLGSLRANVVRLFWALFFLMMTTWYMSGAPWPQYASVTTWMWMMLSGFVGFTFGDYCLFNSYRVIGSRFGQLFMTLSPIAAAIAAWAMLGETMSLMAIIGMILTLSGIALSILTRETSAASNKKRTSIKLPLNGILYGIGAGTAQGLGIVLSKIGMVEYEASIPACATEVISTIPVSATLIRSIAGLTGFVFMLAFSNEGLQSLPSAIRDRKGMLYITLGAIFGPFVGVALSLLAVQHTDAGIASTIMALTPVLILIPARFLQHQKITLPEIAGAIISVVGVAMFFL